MKYDVVNDTLVIASVFQYLANKLAIDITSEKKKLTLKTTAVMIL
jgi:hypothetical protein